MGTLTAPPATLVDDPSSPPPSLAAPDSQYRLDFIDCLRALAALWVLTVHATTFTYGENVNAIPEQLFPLAWLARYDHQAVTAFICISGFSLFLSIAKNNGRMKTSVAQYALTRARRILPPYYAALAVGAVVTHWLMPLPHALFWHQLIDQIFLVQDYTTQTNYILPPTWSIAVEWHIYIILPILALAFVRFGIVRTLLVTTVATYAATHWITITKMYFSYYALFAVGGAAALIAFSNVAAYSRFRSLPWSLISIVTLALWVAGIFIVEGDFQFGLGVCAGLVALANNPKRMLASRPLQFIGQYSYSIYLFHWSALLILLHYIGPKPWFLPIGIVVSLISIYPIFLIVERPFMSRSKAAR